MLDCVNNCQYEKITDTTQDVNSSIYHNVPPQHLRSGAYTQTFDLNLNSLFESDKEGCEPFLVALTGDGNDLF